MIKFLYRLFNQDEIDRLNNKLEIHRARTEQLEAEVREYKGYKLKYEVTKLYIDDEEGLLELFEIAEKNERHLVRAQSNQFSLRQAAELQQQGMAQRNALIGASAAIGFGQGLAGLGKGGW